MPLEHEVLPDIPAEARQERLRTFMVTQATHAPKEVTRSYGPGSGNLAKPSAHLYCVLPEDTWTTSERSSCRRNASDRIACMRHSEPTPSGRSRTNTKSGNT